MPPLATKLKLTAPQIKLLVETLNKAFKEKSHKEKASLADYTFDPVTSGEIRTALEKGSPEGLALFDQVSKLLDEDDLRKSLGGAITYDTHHDKQGAVPDYYGAMAIKSFKGPKTKKEHINIYDWQWRMDHKGAFTEDSDKILTKLPAAERKALIAKLDFPARWEVEKDPQKGWTGLVADVPLKKCFLNINFYTEKFIKAAQTRLKVAGADADTIDHEKLVENLAAWFNDKIRQEDEYHDSEEYALEQDDGYSKGEAEEKDFKKLRDDSNFDDSVLTYIQRLEDIGVDENEIQNLLVGNGEKEFSSSYHNVDNSMGSFEGGRDEQIDFGRDDDQGFADDNKDKKDLFPFPEDLDANIALMDTEDVEKFQKEIDIGAVDIRYNATDGCYEVKDMTVYTSDSNSVHWVLDVPAFISQAKRLIKNDKLSLKEERREQKRLAGPKKKHPSDEAMERIAEEDAAERKRTGVDEDDNTAASSYPTVSSVLADPYATVSRVLAAKKKPPTDDELMDALKFLKDSGLVPTGHGKPTLPSQTPPFTITLDPAENLYYLLADYGNDKKDLWTVTPTGDSEYVGSVKGHFQVQPGWHEYSDSDFYDYVPLEVIQEVLGLLDPTFEKDDEDFGAGGPGHG
jgi:hypothetical protein